MTSRNNRHRRRAHREDLAQLRTMLIKYSGGPRIGSPLSRREACGLARTVADRLLQEQEERSKRKDFQSVYDAAIRGIGLSTLTSQFAFAQDIYIISLRWYARGLDYR